MDAAGFDLDLAIESTFTARVEEEALTPSTLGPPERGRAAALEPWPPFSECADDEPSGVRRRPSRTTRLILEVVARVSGQGTTFSAVPGLAGDAESIAAEDARGRTGRESECRESPSRTAVSAPVRPRGTRGGGAKRRSTTRGDPWPRLLDVGADVR